MTDNFSGPLVGQIVFGNSPLFDDLQATIPVQDILEEGMVFPVEEESTQNNARGEAEQASVKLTFSLPVFVRETDGLQDFELFLDHSPKVWVLMRNQFLTEEDLFLRLGGLVGLKVRKVSNENAQFGNFGVTVYTFETTYARSGQGYEIVADADLF
jgi:hypothetical protein